MRAWLIAVSVAVLAPALPSCEVKQRAKQAPTGQATPDEVRAQVLAGVSEKMREPRAGACFAKRPEYCIEVTDLLEPIVEGVVTRDYDGLWPTEPADVRSLIRKARRVYEDPASSPEAIARVEEKVRTRYAAPVITVEGDVARADHGHVPGELHATARWGLLLETSASGGEDLSAEVGRLFRSLAAAQPSSPVLEVVRMVHASSSGPTTWTYRYDTRTRRIRVDDGEPKRWWAAEVPTLADLGTTVSLRTRDLTRCSRRKHGDDEVREICR